MRLFSRVLVAALISCAPTAVPHLLAQTYTHGEVEIANGALPYVSTLNYAAGALVTYGGYTYVSPAGGNLGNTPSLTSSKWSEIGLDTLTPAQIQTALANLTGCTNSTYPYVPGAGACLAPATGFTPPTSTAANQVLMYTYAGQTTPIAKKLDFTNLNDFDHPLAGAATSKYTQAAEPYGASILSEQGFQTFVAPVMESNLRFVFDNSYTRAPDVCGPAYTLEATIEYPVDSGNRYPLTFHGLKTIEVDPCATVQTDPWMGTIDPAVGNDFQVRFLAQKIASAGIFPAGWIYGSATPLATAVYPDTTTKLAWDGVERMRYTSSIPLTATDCATTSGSTTVTSNTLGFLYYQDQGQTITVNGAGASGANLTTTLATVTNGVTTSAVMATAAGTTVSGASCTLTPTDKTTTGTILTSQGAGQTAFGSIGVLADQLGKQEAVVIEGDSISALVGSNYCQGTWIEQALNPATAALGTTGGYCTSILTGVPYLNMSEPGETIFNFASTPGHYNRFSQNTRGKYIGGMLGTNDFGGYTTAQTEAAAIKLWIEQAMTGGKPFYSTVIVQATSNDNDLSIAGQTQFAQNSNRVAFNNWMRDGAPIDCTTGAALATGTTSTNALRAPYYNYSSTAATYPSVAGSVGSSCTNTNSSVVLAAHPLAFTYELADAVESGRDSGYWAPDPATRAGTGCTTSGTTLTCAAGTFTAADKGATISVPNAGTGGTVPFNTTIATYTSATQVTMAATPTTAITTAESIEIGGIYDNPANTTTGSLVYRGDNLGLHPSWAGHYRMGQIAGATLAAVFSW